MLYCSTRSGSPALLLVSQPWLASRPTSNQNRLSLHSTPTSDKAQGQARCAPRSSFMTGLKYAWPSAGPALERLAANRLAPSLSLNSILCPIALKVDTGK